MNRRAQVQWTVSGVIEAPVEQVWTALLSDHSVLPKGVYAAIAHQADQDHFNTTVGRAGEGKIHIEIDQRQHSVSIEGEWWYRGVYLVEPHRRGSKIEYCVYNIAPGAGWWAAQLMHVPQHAREMEKQLQSIMHGIGERVGCKTQAVTA